jgi:hypothetical protein
MNIQLIVLGVVFLVFLSFFGIKHIKLILQNIKASKQGKVNVRQIGKTGRELNLGWYKPTDEGAIIIKNKMKGTQEMYPYDKNSVYINNYNCPTILYTPNKKHIDLYSGGVKSFELNEMDNLLAITYNTAKAGVKSNETIDFMTKMVIVVGIVASIGVSWYYGKDIPVIIEMLQKMITTL